MMTAETNIANKWNPNSGFVHANDKQAQQTEKLNRALVALGKRCFIASNALRTSTGEDAAKQYERYLDSLNNYLSQVENALDQAAFFDFAAAQPRRTQFGGLKFRLRNFLKTNGRTALRHPELFAKALCRIDHLVVDMHMMDRERADLRGSLN